MKNRIFSETQHGIYQSAIDAGRDLTRFFDVRFSWPVHLVPDAWMLYLPRGAHESEDRRHWLDVDALPAYHVSAEELFGSDSEDVAPNARGITFQPAYTSECYFQAEGIEVDPADDDDDIDGVLAAEVAEASRPWRYGIEYVNGDYSGWDWSETALSSKERRETVEGQTPIHRGKYRARVGLIDALVGDEEMDARWGLEFNRTRSGYQRYAGGGEFFKGAELPSSVEESIESEIYIVGTRDGWHLGRKRFCWFGQTFKSVVSRRVPEDEIWSMSVTDWCYNLNTQLMSDGVDVKDPVEMADGMFRLPDRFEFAVEGSLWHCGSYGVVVTAASTGRHRNIRRLYSQSRNQLLPEEERVVRVCAKQLGKGMVKHLLRMPRTVGTALRNGVPLVKHSTRTNEACRRVVNHRVGNGHYTVFILEGSTF
jgi:hypothetical protein